MSLYAERSEEPLCHQNRVTTRRPLSRASVCWASLLLLLSGPLAWADPPSSERPSHEPQTGGEGVLPTVSQSPAPTNGTAQGEWSGSPAGYELPTGGAGVLPTVSRRIENSLGMEFVRIPAGSFVMGSPESEKERDRYETRDETRHRVTLTRAFYLQTTEVTQAQWQAVMGNNPSRFQGANRPVEQVSWNEVQEFIRKLNQWDEGTYRLPTEAEWEYAARAGTTTPFGIGNGRDLNSTQANFNGNDTYGRGKEGVERAETKPVQTFVPNAWGLYDMHGNVWEWVQDWDGAYPTEAVRDPQGPSSGENMVLRGGSWYYLAKDCRSAIRLTESPENGYPENGYSDIGFRLVKEIK